MGVGEEEPLLRGQFFAVVLLLLAVPVPLVDLDALQAHPLGDLQLLLVAPVGIFLVLLFEARILRLRQTPPLQRISPVGENAAA